MKTSGHWFCEHEHCNAVVRLPVPGNPNGNVPPAKCPFCHRRTAVWLPHVERPASEEMARDWFAEMRHAVAATPDLLPSK